MQQQGGQRHEIAQCTRRCLITLIIWSLVFPPFIFKPQPAWGAFDNVTAARLPQVSDASYRVAVGDVDGNGAPDLLVANNGQARLLLNDGSGTFSDQTGRLPTLSTPTLAIALGDVDGDSDLDLLLAQAPGANQLLLNDGSGFFTAAPAGALPSVAQISMDAALVDVDGDGDLDLLVANHGSANRLWLNDGSGSFTAPPSPALPADPDPSVALHLTDLNGDGAPDLVVANHRAPPRLYLNNGIGVFSEVTATHLPPVGDDHLDVTSADVDGDGDRDLLLAAAADGLRLLINDGQGVFSDGTANLPALSVYGIQVAAGDIDEDGQPDIVLAAAGQDRVLLGDGTGTFQDATAAWFPVDTQRSFGGVLLDGDGDLDLDLLLATPGGQNRLLTNATLFPRIRLSAAPAYVEVGTPVTLTIQAFDEDGLGASSLTLTDPASGSEVIDLTTDLADGLATHGFTPTLAGVYTASVTAQDTQGTSHTRQLAIAVAAPDTTAPLVSLNLNAPSPLLVGHTVTIQVTATDDVGVVDTALTVNGVSVPLPGNGIATYVTTSAGLHSVEARATDAAGNEGIGTTSFTVDADSEAPAVQVTAVPNLLDVNNAVTLTVTASDNVAVTSQSLQVSGPAIPDGIDLTLDANGQAIYTPFQPGTYTALATALDPSGNSASASATFDAQGVPDTTPPSVTLTATPQTLAIGGSVTLTVTASDDIGVTVTSLEINDTPVILDASGQAVYTPPIVGDYTAVALAQDAFGNSGSATLTLRAVNPEDDTTPPVVSIATPAANSEVTAPTAIVGTVQDETLVSYTLDYAVRGTNQFTTFASGTTEVFGAELGTFDPTLLLNDLYDIRLSATDINGLTTSTTVVYQVTGNLKVGNFTLTLQDLTIPVVGLPITLNRTYDSRDKSVGDFGVGWKLDIQTTRIRENRLFGTGWEQGKLNSLTWCVRPTDDHYVSITLPDGRVETFDVTLNPECLTLLPVQETSISFTPRAGTHSTLEAIGDPVVTVVGTLDSSTYKPVELVQFDASGGNLYYDPVQYQLTTREGMVLGLDETFGVRTMTDPNGNTLTISESGISHSAGKSVPFTRDAQGRITQITDPMGNTIQYAYDASGDLASVTDQEQQTAQYLYNATHGLTDIIDPRGITPARNIYDDDGRLIAHVDADGNRIDYTHDVEGRQEIVTDRLGNITLFIYDDDGNVLSQTDPLGNTTTFTYDAQGNKLSETDPLNHTTTFTYDANDNVLTETDPLDHTTTFTYNSRNQVLTTTNPLGHTTTNTYDTQGNLLTTTDALNHTTTNIYDARGLQTSNTDPLGHVTTYAYNPAGYLITATDPLGHMTTYTYDSNGNRLSQTTTRTTSAGSETLTTTYTYDGRNRLVQTTYADGSTTQVVYNAIGQQSATFDQMGRQTTYNYDDLGRLVQTTSPDGTSEASTYDAEGRRLTRIDRSGRVTSFQYDPVGGLIETTYADGATTQTEYDPSGQVVATTDPLGNVTQFVYDAAGRRITMTDALGHSTTFTYNEVGNRTAVIDANGNTTSYEYDQNNHRTIVRYPDGTLATTTYNPLGRPESTTDQAGKTTRFAYDSLGRLVTVTDALGQVTQYTYDELGHRLTQTDANNHTTRFAYDQLGRRITRTLPLGMDETTAYDAVGNQISKTDFNGKTTTYEYDAANRLIRKTPDPSVPEPSVHFTYTATGQRATMTDASGTTTYTYDARDRLIRKATPQGTLHYTYDQAGKPVSISSSQVNGVSLTYTYDELNRLVTVTDHRLNPGTTTYGYDAVGNLTNIVSPNGVQSTYLYDPLNRLTALTIQRTSTLASYTYTLGPAGHRLAVTELSGRTVTYAYDDLYRLTQETISEDPSPTNNGTISYTYDPVGNRLTRISTLAAVPSATYAYDQNDRLLSDTYDFNGNTTESSGTTYAYDFENHLTDQNSGAVTIVYDGDGHRVAQTVAGVTTQYLVDDRNRTGYAQVLEERMNGTVQRVYTYGRTRISQRQAAGTTFYGYDGHGSVRVLTDADGTLTDTYEYSAAGELLSHTGTTPNDYLFAGEQFDTALALYYNRARFLKVETGRFLTRDTYEGSAHDPLPLHAYTYARNDVVNRVDPSGHRASLIGVLVTVGISAILAAITSIILIKKFAITPPGEEEQLPLPGVAKNYNYNAIELLNAPSATEIFEDYVRTFVGVNEGTVAKVTGGPVSGAGQKLTFTLKGWKGLAQPPFSVRVKRYTQANHAFSVATLKGHPLSGWRYWRVAQLGNHPGHLRVETGAIDTPAPGFIYKIAFDYTRPDQLRIWEENLQYILLKSGARAGPDSDLVGGTWLPNQSHLEQQICAGASFCK